MKNQEAFEILQRGMQKLHQEDYFGAIEDFTQSIQINEDYIEAYLARADAKMSTQDTYQILNAYNDYEKVISLDPNNAKAIAGRGRISLLLNSDDKDGLEDLEKAASIDPNESSYFNIGIARLQLEHFEMAIEAFEKYIKLEKPSGHWLGETHYFIGRCFHSLDDYETAIYHYQSGIKFKADQNYEYCFINKADCYIQLNKFDEAIEDLKKVIKLKPEQSDAYLTLSRIYSHKGDKEYALEILDESLRINRTNLDILFYKSELLFRSEEFHKGIEVNNKIIEIEPKNFGGYFNKALCYFKLSKYEDSITAFNEAIKIEPNRGHAYFYRGMAYMNLKSNNACRDWKIAADLEVKEAKKYLHHYCKTS